MTRYDYDGRPAFTDTLARRDRRRRFVTGYVKGFVIGVALVLVGQLILHAGG